MANDITLYHRETGKPVQASSKQVPVLTKAGFVDDRAKTTAGKAEIAAEAVAAKKAADKKPGA